MKVTFTMQVKLIIILLSVSQMVNTFCSRQIHPQPSSRIIENNIEEKQITASVNKAIKVRHAKADKTSLEPEPEKARNITPDEIISTAQKYLGVPHCMSGTTAKCIDCSGLLVKVFASHGIYLPHNSEEQSRYGKKISGRDELKKGDLVFFIRSYKTNRFITHSGIYIGNNKFIHASSSKGVTITSLSNPWWNEKFIFGTRLFD